MKTKVITLLVIGTTALGFAQEQETEERLANNELKLNLGYTLAGFPELSYERILSDNTSLGLAATFSITDNDLGFDYMLSPHFRVYFGKKRASGFFLEMNAAFYGSDYGHYYTFEGNRVSRGSDFGFGLGMAVGVKLINKLGWTSEIYAGMGRELLGNTSNLGYPRAGLSIGKRF